MHNLMLTQFNCYWLLFLNGLIVYFEFVRTCHTLSLYIEECTALSGPVEAVQQPQFWLNQFSLKVKIKFHLYKKQVIDKIASVIWAC